MKKQFKSIILSAVLLPGAAAVAPSARRMVQLAK